jgi:SAM-dependent methyltransferase
VKAPTKRLPVSPSKTLIKFGDHIASLGEGPIIDAPCGYGRNAVALAARGCTVIAVDKDRKRLAVLDQLKVGYVAERASVGVSTGKILTVCADLTAEGWPVAQSSVSAIVCVHFAMIDLIPSFISSLRTGGHLYTETFGGQGQNFRELPRAGQLRELLSRYVEFRYYKEQKVGPPEIDSVSVILLAKRR